MTHGTPQPSPIPPESAERGFEVRDARARSIVVFAISLVAVAAVIHIAAWKVLRMLDRQEDQQNAQLYPGDPLSISVHPPEPTLEPEPHHDILPKADLDQVRARQLSIIGPNALAWADPNHHFARIPLDQAIELAINSGLPTTLPATQPATQPFMPPASAVHGPGGVP